MAFVSVPVRSLKVIAYVDVKCQARPWHLRVLPITECACFIAVANNDQAVYEAELQRIARRPEAKRHYPYEKFMGLVEEIRRDGGFNQTKAAREPMKVYAGTENWLEDGHHRAAIICALYPTSKVEVAVLNRAQPRDIGKCGAASCDCDDT